jgi:hypothetical protein
MTDYNPAALSTIGSLVAKTLNDHSLAPDGLRRTDLERGLTEQPGAGMDRGSIGPLRAGRSVLIAEKAA